MWGLRTRKKSKAIAGIQAVFWLLALSAGMVLAMWATSAQIAQSGYTFYSYVSFVEQLQLNSLVQYWQARSAWDEKSYEPSGVLLSDTNSAFYALNRAHEQGEEITIDFLSPVEADSQRERHGGLAVYEEDARAEIDSFNEMMREYEEMFSGSWRNLYCTVIDSTDGRVWAPYFDLSDFAKNPGSFDFAPWGYVVAVNFNGDGDVYSAVDWSDPYGDSGVDTWYRMGSDWGYSKSYLPQDVFRYYDFVVPHDITLIFAIPRMLPENDTITQYGYYNHIHRFMDAFDLWFAAAIAVSALLALWFGRRRGSGLGGKRLAAVPAELGCAACFGVCSLGAAVLSQCLTSLCDGDIAENLQNNFSVDLPAAADAFAFVVATIVAFAVFGCAFLCVLAVRQGIARYGWKAYLLRHSLLGMALRVLRAAWRVVGRQIVRLWGALTRVDLRDSVNSTLLRLLAVNFVIVSFICTLWVFGILGTILYTAVLFFLLRGRLEKEQQHYAELLAAARRMAAGDLTTPITGDLGMFDPLRDELNQVRDGFEKAVAAEVRSQNMKTELISNVSHDLKTPLTAIITYVDLLKDPALPEADRAKYIDTLDRKSQRLKRLIEDLFEVSKAATGNVTMHYTEVDLAALLKQVQYELADKLQDCGIDFRWQLPDMRVPLVLDGQKTCRIFENLLINITKYGMPGTRAYITLTPLSDGAQIVFKNISAAELDFDTQQITERFVRGDKSRNTEGSGLGLAIVKSFAVLQGGSFEVAADGDLFKAIVTLPDDNVPEAPELPQPPILPESPVLPGVGEEL